MSQSSSLNINKQFHNVDTHCVFIYSTFCNTLTPTKGNKRFWRSSSSFRKSISSSNWTPVHWKLMSRKLFTMWLVTWSLVEAVMLPQDQQWRLARGLCKLRRLKRRSEPNLWHWSRDTFSRQGKELWHRMSLNSLSVKLPTNWRLMLLKIDNPGFFARQSWTQLVNVGASLPELWATQ